MRFCCFYLTGKQDKKRGDFDYWTDYARYVASLIEIGDSVKVLCDVYRHRGVRKGQTGSVVSDAVTDVDGLDLVAVQFDGVDNDLMVRCGNLEILN